MEYISELVAHCRVCLLELESDIESYHLEDEDSRYHKTYRELLTEIQTYKFLSNAPDKLCGNCRITLLEIYKFNETLLETQNILEGSVCEKKPLYEIVEEIVDEDSQEDTDDDQYVIETVNFYEAPMKIEDEAIEVDYQVQEEDDTNQNYDVIVGVTAIETDNTQNTDDQQFIQIFEYICSFCGMQYKSDNDLKSHIQTKHSEHQMQIQCPYCSYMADTLDGITSGHLDTCPGLQKGNNMKNLVEYICPYCDVTKPTKPRLEKHIEAMHIGLEAIYECDICHKKSKTKSALYSHMKNIHVTKDEFSCEFCNEKYKSISGFKYHMAQYHTHLDMQKCHICDFETKQKFLLKRHLKRHSGKYRCSKNFLMNFYTLNQ